MKVVIDMIRGFCMAMADSVPGVSGGTIAFLMGFYDKFINSLNDLISGKKAEKIEALKFLAKLGVGWVVGFVSCVLILTKLFDTYIYEISSLFIGLTLFAIPVVFMEEKKSLKGKYWSSFFVILGAALVFCITCFNPTSGGESGISLGQPSFQLGISLFFVAMIAITAMVLPGISGSTLLLIFGFYLPIINSIKELLHLHFEYLPMIICFGMSVIVSVVAENTSRVISVEDISPEMIKNQIDAVFEDIEVDAVKVGMLSSEICMKAVAEKLRQYKPKYTVIDPVMVAKGGHALMKPEALEALKTEVIPLAYVLTPNIPEAETITEMSIESQEDVQEAAKKIYSLGAKNVLIKGGHLSGDAIDLLYDGKSFYTFTTERINTKNTHGTGCTFSSAITANLANGLNLNKAVEKAKTYITTAIEHSLPIGKGHGPTNHFYELYMKGLQL